MNLRQKQLNYIIMAKIKWGMIVTDGRGKLGGQVFSKNRAGAYIRTKTTPTNPQTTAQTLVRQSFAVFSQAWSGLATALILAWNGAVSEWSKTDIFGDIRNPTGKNLFLRLNQQATLAGYPSFTAVPAKKDMVEGVISTASFSTDQEELTLTGVFAGANAKVMMFATPVLSKGTSYVKNKLRNVFNSTGNVFNAADSYAAYVAKYGAPSIGSNIYIGVKYVLDNGQASPMQIVKATVVL